MSDEKLSTAQRPPEKEEAAPAPASAPGTAQTSNEVTIDITTLHGDAQSITETNTAESPSQLGVPAPETSGSDDAWRYVCALINEFTSEEDYRSGDFGREHVREPDPYAINQVPVVCSRKKDCARREGAAFADRLEHVFDELDDEMQAVVRDGWAGREAAREPKSREGSCAERASRFADRLFRELTGGEAGSDDCARGFIECGDTLLNCFDAGCFSLGVAAVHALACGDERVAPHLQQALAAGLELILSELLGGRLLGADVPAPIVPAQLVDREHRKLEVGIGVDLGR